MNARERWIMAAILAAIALYLFGWQALYLYAAAGAIYFFSRGRR